MNVKQIDYHRNGVSGNGFYIVQFTDAEISKGNGNMIGIVFSEPGNVAVFDFELLKQGETRFFHNSWRGDNFESELREAIEEHNNRSFAEFTIPPLPVDERMSITFAVGGVDYTDKPETKQLDENGDLPY